MGLSLDMGYASVWTGGQVSEQPRGGWVGHAFGDLGAV